MSLPPLGFSTNHLQLKPLGQNQFLRTLPPLGQFAQPLGQNFQPLQPPSPLNLLLQTALLDPFFELTASEELGETASVSNSSNSSDARIQPIAQSREELSSSSEQASSKSKNTSASEESSNLESSGQLRHISLAQAPALDEISLSSPEVKNSTSEESDSQIQKLETTETHSPEDLSIFEEQTPVEPIQNKSLALQPLLSEAVIDSTEVQSPSQNDEDQLGKKLSSATKPAASVQDEHTSTRSNNLEAIPEALPVQLEQNQTSSTISDRVSSPKQTRVSNNSPDTSSQTTPVEPVGEAIALPTDIVQAAAEPYSETTAEESSVSDAIAIPEDKVIEQPSQPQTKEVLATDPAQIVLRRSASTQEDITNIPADNYSSSTEDTTDTFIDKSLKLASNSIRTDKTASKVESIETTPLTSQVSSASLQKKVESLVTKPTEQQEVLEVPESESILEAQSANSETDGWSSSSNSSDTITSETEDNSSKLNSIQPSIERVSDSTTLLHEPVILPSESVEVTEEKTATEPEELGEERSPLTDTSIEQSSNVLSSLKPLGSLTPLTQISNFISPIQLKLQEQAETTLQAMSSMEDSDILEESLQNDDRSLSIMRSEKASDENTSSVSETPTSWSSLAELLGENSTSYYQAETFEIVKSTEVSNPDIKDSSISGDAIAEPIPLQRKRTEFQPQPSAEEFNAADDRSSSWSSLAELADNTYSSSNLSYEDDPEAEESATNNSVDNSVTLISSRIQAKSDEQVGNANQQKLTVDDQQLVMLAQHIYNAMRHCIDLDQERSGYLAIAYPIWSSNIISVYETSAQIKSNSIKTGERSPTPSHDPSVDSSISVLTREVYSQIQQKLAIEHERSGYRISRLH
ncbi:hypothetical protein H6F93_02825 [Leptolyngbya sp. FACHB-671]|uniref:hypothetical protein n=1 Tax=Leptolyngbya sp. FACHB-671 TaxID=2692812 RepID=UPI0016876840|nr:hypothetical protein [Leptolyngbya sp. FACHB-671]MBD2066468.1 hypothetical protein [Leptolyngbya sp. FACHB-671]